MTTEYDIWVETIDGVRVPHPPELKYPSQLNDWVKKEMSICLDAEVRVAVWKHAKGENRNKFYSPLCWTIDTLALEMFEKMCKEHDWYYAYSDDGRVYRAGAAAEDELKRRYAWLRQKDIKASVEAIWETYSKLS